jgi:ABC-type transport system involved in cytochrome c biogenesis permease subunit
MNSLLRDARDLIVSLKLTVVLIMFSIILVLVATLDQVNLGIWVVQQKYFNTFIVFWKSGNLSLAVFPGGYTIGGLLLVNLLAGHFYRFKFTWRKAGIWLTHAGLILLLVGQLLTALWQDEYQLRLDQGQTKNFSESYRNVELVITDTTDPKFDDVISIPEGRLVKKDPVQHPKLPFRVTVKTYFPNATLQMKTAAAAAAEPAGVATQGVGPQVIATLQPVTSKQDERNIPSAYVELAGADGVIGTWLVSPFLDDPQRFAYAGRTWKIALRFARHYQPYALTLLKFSHDRYAGTEIPKNFSSRLRLTTPDGKDDREVLIYMNNPLRYAGLTFYQAGFENNDTTTVLQVVRNPSWLIPYIACGVMTFGLVFQFGLHLIGFIGKRRNPAARGASAPAKVVPTGPRWPAARVFPLTVLVLTALAVLVSLFPPRAKGEFDFTGFGRQPTLVNGRIKPLDTVARTSLLVLQGRQRVSAPDGRSIHPDEWLLDMLYRPEQANQYQVFEIVHPDVLTLFNLTPEDGAGKKRYSFQQLIKGIPELDRQAKLADAVESALRTSFQRAVVQLRDAIVLYESLGDSLVAPGFQDYLGELSRLNQIVSEAKATPANPAAAKRLLDLSNSFSSLETFGYLRPIPPQSGKMDAKGWMNPGAAMRAGVERGQLDAATATYVGLGIAWRAQQPAAFNGLVHDYRASLDKEIPSFLAKCDVEARFNSAQPFYTSMIIYVIAFLLAVFSWLKWPDALGSAAFRLVGLAWVLATVGIATRMWLEGRPPVTNLYSSALFIGWGAVALCLVLEVTYRNAIGSVAAGLIGFGTLLIAHHLALGGDTLEMMRAVLDSNFWLATHVVTVTVGYSATFLAGFLALIYVIRGVLTRSLDAATADSLARMVYGVVCFATVLSFVGTVLGGIWADQSWGRFWGWDPKENGALIIVLWNALILHARWGGMVKQRGLMALAIFGNIVTAWSWFGVNMLGVGLHSYGFIDAAFWWLLGFVISQVCFILAANLPMKAWRSSATLTA